MQVCLHSLDNITAEWELSVLVIVMGFYRWCVFLRLFFYLYTVHVNMRLAGWCMCGWRTQLADKKGEGQVTACRASICKQKIRKR